MHIEIQTHRGGESCNPGLLRLISVRQFKELDLEGISPIVRGDSGVSSRAYCGKKSRKLTRQAFE
jgi:hypothetical protein